MDRSIRAASRGATPNLRTRTTGKTGTWTKGRAAAQVVVRFVEPAELQAQKTGNYQAHAIPPRSQRIGNKHVFKI